jgi:hypothetical protein
VVVFRYVRYAPNSDQILRRTEMTLWAISGDKLHRSKIGLLDHLIRSGEEGASSSSSSPRRHRLMRDCEKPFEGSG